MEPATSALHGVRQMIERAGAAQNPEDALRWILDELDAIVPGEVKAFVLLDDDGQSLRVRIATGLDPGFVAEFEREVGDGVLADVVWAGRVRGLKEADPSSDEYKALRLDRAFGSGIAAPVTGATRRFGYLWVQTEKRLAFTLEHLTLISLSASLAGQVLSHIRARDECARLVPIDLGTGLLRHLEFMRRLGQEIDRARRAGRSVSALIVHVEGMTRLRAKGGREAAEEAAAELGRAARGALRGVDILGYQGSGRIEVCLPETSVEEALLAGKRLREAVERVAAESYAEASLRASVGVAEFPADADNGRTLTAKASSAVVEARRLGGDLVARARPE